MGFKFNKDGSVDKRSIPRKSDRKNNGNVHPTRIFQTPEDLLDCWNGYKKHLQRVECKKWPKVQYVGRDGERVVDYPVMPISQEGFERYCFENDIGNVQQYFDNQQGYYDDFIAVCARVKREIREQHITGGMNGFYNPSITQRLHGLVDKQEVQQFNRPILEQGKELPEDE